MSIRVTPEELARDLQRRFRSLPRAIERGIIAGANRGRRLLTKRTPVDTGQMKNAWRISKFPKPELFNDAPHAGIIEGGARPHKVNAEGRAALVRWAMRQLGVDLKTAQAVAAGTIRKLEKFGQRGLFIARDAMPQLREEVVREVVRRLRAQSKRRAG